MAESASGLVLAVAAEVSCASDRCHLDVGASLLSLRSGTSGDLCRLCGWVGLSIGAWLLVVVLAWLLSGVGALVLLGWCGWKTVPDIQSVLRRVGR